MTTVSRVSQVSHTNVAGTADWDHRLNRLLEDLQDTVIPSDSKLGNANEYREFRMTQRSQVNDEPVQQIDEKWVEVGTTGGGSLSIPQGSFGSGSAGGTTRFGEKTVAFSDDLTSSSRSFESSSRRDNNQMEFLAPQNSTTVLRSGPSSPIGYTTSMSKSDTSPKVEKKEFYAKSSYTTLIKGGPELVPQFGEDRTDRDRILQDIMQQSSSQSSRNEQSSESTKRSYLTDTTVRRVEEHHPPVPLYTSTPISKTSQSRDYSREMITDTTRSVTPPPKPGDALRTPPMLRKILQTSQPHPPHPPTVTESYEKSSRMTSKTISSTTSGSGGRPPVGGVPLPIQSPQRERIPPYDESSDRSAARYYTSTTKTEHREREMSPVKRFPSPLPPRGDTEPPKRLDELLASFGESYSESSTTRYTSDGSGAHKSIPYGPGVSHVQPLRQVRIDDTVRQRQIDEDAELVQRKVGRSDLESRNVAGPPVFYPPGQIFQKTEEEALAQESGKGKMKAKREYKAKEKMSSKHSEKGGEGAVPVPVCLPVCCAAPCVIM